MVDSENENSEGWMESHADTPNSVDLVGGRSSEVHTVDSSSSSSLCGSIIVNVDDEDEEELKCRSSIESTSGSDAVDSSLWEKYFGNAEGETSVY